MPNSHRLALIAFLLPLVPLVAFTTPGLCEELSLEQRQHHVLSMEKFIQISHNQKALEIAASQLSPEEKNNLIVSYADHVSENLDPTRETEANYLRFLKVSNQFLGHNKVCKHFYNCAGEAAIINIEGLNSLIKILQEKGELGDVTALAAEDLPEKLNQLSRSSPSEKTFLVWHGDNKHKDVPAVGKHITPLFIRKTNEGVLAIVTDSTGMAASGYNNRIKQILTQSKLKHHNLNIYMTTLDRQKDSFSCPVFSLLDARQHFKSNLFQYIDQYEHTPSAAPGTHNESEAESCSQLHRGFVFEGQGPHFKHNTALPPQVLQHAQSFSKIRQYLNSQSNTRTISQKEAQKLLNHLENHRYTENEINKSGYIRTNAYLFYNELVKNLANANKNEKNKEGFFPRFYKKINKK